MDSIQQAARELIELEALVSNLHARRQRCLTRIDDVDEVHGTRYLFGDYDAKYTVIFEAQWDIYDYVNTLHALWAFVRQSSEFIEATYAPRSRTPELIALRNCMQHNGPVEVNHDGERGELIVPIQRLKRRGDWGGHNPSFESYFPKFSPGDTILLGESIDNSDVVYRELLSAVERRHIETHGQENIERAAAKLSVYR